MSNDWSSFTPQRVRTLPRYTDAHAPGFLVWAKIDHACLYRHDLAELLSEEPSTAELERSGDECRKAVAAAKARIRHAVRELRICGIRRICTGVSWCDMHCMPGAHAWVRWYLEAFAEHFEVLPRVTFTPPPLTEGGKYTINAAPAEPVAYAEFLHGLLEEFGDLFGDYVELWNEWNIVTDWQVDLDPGYQTFMTMIACGALVAHHHGKEAVLGGMTGVSDENACGLVNFATHGLFRYIDVVGFHDLRGTWSDDVPSASIPEQVQYVRTAISFPPAKHAWLLASVEQAALRANGETQRVIHEQQFRLRKADDLPDVWLTEYGFPVVDPDQKFSEQHLQDIQLALFAYLADCIRSGALTRGYWYTFQDFVGESVRKHTTGWEDVLQHYYGIVCEQGECRLLGTLLKWGGPHSVHRYALQHELFSLVDAASLGRSRPTGYQPGRTEEILPP